ncbi:MAG: hypothetical protein IEMM0002_1368 [bacterium]|nr:MAG: hypothetical protein IEMM0002_1368 [bacterium]
MEIILNGQTRTVGEPMSVSGLISELSLPEKTVIVEYNKLPLERGRYENTRIKNGDRIEIATMFAGG